MQNAQGIRAGRAFVELFADDRQLVRGLRRAQRRVQAFGRSIRGFGLRLAGVATAMLAPLAASAKVFSTMGDQVAKMARRTGFSVQTLSELGFVASQTGTDLGSLEQAIRRMQRSIFDAGRGLSTATDALDELGLSFEALDGLSPEAQFKKLADRISQVEDPTRRAAIALTLFGRSGTSLLPMFAQGAQGMEALQARARELGLTMSGEDAQAAEDFTDALDRLIKVLKVGVFRIGAALAPLLQRIADVLTAVAVRTSAWIDQNRAAVVTVAKVAAGVLVAGAGITALGVAVIGLGSVLGILASGLAGAGTVLGAITAALGAVLTPLGAVITAVGVLGAKVVASSGAAGGAVNWLADRFGGLRDAASASLRGIAEALARGDVPAAAQVLWASLRLIWVQGIAALDRLWLGFTDTFLRAGQDAFAGLVAASQIGLNALEVGWIEATAAVSRAWSGFTAFFARSWVRMQAIARKAWLQIRALFDGSVRRSAQATRAEIDRQRDAALGRIDQQQARANDRRERQRAAERQAAARLNEATLAAIGRDNLRRHRELDTAYEQRIAQTQAELDRAQAAWQEAIDQVGKAPAPGINSGTVPTIDRGLLQTAQDAIDQLGDTLAQQTARITTRGTFLAANVLGLQGATSGGGGDNSARIAAGIDRIERNTRALRHADALSFT